MSTKKAPVKKPPVKKTTLPKVAKLVPTSDEKYILDKVAEMLGNGYSVKLNCADRHKMCKSIEGLLEYLRANEAYELIGMKPGCQALAFGIK